ncbi:MAG: hypothetical protein AB7G87_04960 [Clostridia bacterium]
MNLAKKSIVLIILCFLVVNFFSFNVAYAASEQEPIILQGFKHLFNGIGYFGNKILQALGSDLDTTIYNYNPTSGKTSMFQVNFMDGSESPFSQIGLDLNAIFTSIALIMMFLILRWKGGKLMFNLNTRNKVDFNETLINYVASFALIFFIPMIMNFVLFMVDKFVQALYPSFIPGGGFISAIAEGTTFADSIVYAGTVIMSVYFVFVYATRAMHIVLFFFMFPIMATYMNSPKFKQNFDTYISDMISTIAIQPIDAALFYGLASLFAAGGALSTGDVGFLKLVIVSAIIPLRGIAKKYLGCSSGSLASDMLGVAGVMGATSLATGFVKGGKSFFGGVTDGATDIKAGKDVLNSFAPEAGGVAAGSAGSTMAGGEGVLPSLSRNFSSQSPDISGFMNNQRRTSAAGPASYTNHDGVMTPIKNPIEAHNQLTKRGAGKIARSAFGAMGGIAGGATGMAMGSLMGPTGMILGANIGGALGGGLGELSGAGMGLVYNPFEKNPSANTASSSDGENSPEINSSLTVAQNANIISPDASASFGMDGAIPEGSIGIDAPGANSINIEDEFKNHVNNMPDNIKESILKDARSRANTTIEQYKGSGYDSDTLEKMRPKVEENYAFQSATDYAFGQLKKSDYNIDQAALDNMSDKMKENVYRRFEEKMNEFKNKDYSVDFNEVI